jgi:hypothetical protein
MINIVTSEKIFDSLINNRGFETSLRDEWVSTKELLVYINYIINDCNGETLLDDALIALRNKLEKKEG